jgi:hypothetical protein
MTRSRLLRFAAVGLFAAVLLAAATPAYAWDSRVAFSGTFVGPYATVGVYGGPYAYSGYRSYRPYRRAYVGNPYYRPYYRSYYSRPYYRSYYPVRRFYVRPAPVYYSGYYGGAYCPY